MNTKELEALGKSLAPSIQRMINDVRTELTTHLDTKLAEMRSQQSATLQQLENQIAGVAQRDALSELPEALQEWRDKYLAPWLVQEHAESLQPIIEQVAALSESVTTLCAAVEEMTPYSRESLVEDLKADQPREVLEALIGELIQPIQNKIKDFIEPEAIDALREQVGDHDQALATLDAAIEKIAPYTAETLMADLGADEARKVLKSLFEEMIAPVQETVNGCAKDIAALPAPENGRDGEPGRDALAINILSGIDFDRSYPRGTYAAHNGGLWHSHAVTDGDRGWECILNGLDDVDVALVNHRELALTLNMANGSSSKKTFTIPAMVYRGIWKAGQYATGDTVTWSGSLWHANQDTDEKPGQSAHWTLSAKKGRDGRDGK